jgi:hypothetical protein
MRENKESCTRKKGKVLPELIGCLSERPGRPSQCYIGAAGSVLDRRGQVEGFEQRNSSIATCANKVFSCGTDNVVGTGLSWTILEKQMYCPVITVILVRRSM